MNVKVLLAIPFLLWGVTALAQDDAAPQDSLKHVQLESIVITATRNERSLQQVPMPVQIVNAAQLKIMGSIRLQDALSEQTGLIIVPQINAQGNGLQLQGFNPDYTLILIDGEPLVGRYTGSLELSRVSVGNIRQIEIVKGPSSSLYGSEALAGVVNILTEPPQMSGGQFSIRYGANQTSDLNTKFSLVNKKIQLGIFGNRYQTAGYDLSPQNFGKTVSPFTNYTVQPKLRWIISPTFEFNLSTRIFHENQQFGFQVVSGNLNTRTFGDGFTKDYNLLPSVTGKFSKKIKSTLRLYATGFQTKTELFSEDGGDLFYQDDFKQKFIRPELVTIIAPKFNHTLTIGAGRIKELVNTSRYGDRNSRTQSTHYGFVQHEWSLTDKTQMISGLRLDQNSVYGSQLSPKWSASHQLHKNLLLKASGGIGFKAPDFRQLYFNFTNSAAGGYSVIGSEVIQSKIAELRALGQIESLLFDLDILDKIRAERSNSINIGMDWNKEKWNGTINGFHNEVYNLIETQVVATTTTGQGIYTYRNIQQAFTRGIESGLQYKPNSNWTLSAGHQLLFAMDRTVYEEVRLGKYFYRDPETLITKRLNKSDYFGLQNRSRHSGNIKVLYRNSSGWEGSARWIWRTKFGVGDIRGNIQGETIPPSDVNSNGILDRFDQFVSGYGLLNLSLAKEFNDGIRFQLGVDNLFNHREPFFIPNLPGRLWYASVVWKFNFKSTIKS